MLHSTHCLIILMVSYLQLGVQNSSTVALKVNGSPPRRVTSRKSCRITFASREFIATNIGSCLALTWKKLVSDHQLWWTLNDFAFRKIEWPFGRLQSLEWFGMSPDLFTGFTAAIVRFVSDCFRGGNSGTYWLYWPFLFRQLSEVVEPSHKPQNLSELSRSFRGIKGQIGYFVSQLLPFFFQI